MKKSPTWALKGVTALAILILGAGCSQSPTAPELAPTDAQQTILIYGGEG